MVNSYLEVNQVIQLKLEVEIAKKLDKINDFKWIWTLVKQEKKKKKLKLNSAELNFYPTLFCHYIHISATPQNFTQIWKEVIVLSTLTATTLHCEL